MFTLVVSLVVVAASVAAVLRLALAEPGQPATGRSATRGGRAATRAARRMKPKQPAAPRAPTAHTGEGSAGAAAMARAAGSGDMARAAGSGAIDLDRVGAFRRIRSGLALLLLLGFVGTVLALAIGTLLFMAGLALRNAVN